MTITDSNKKMKSVSKQKNLQPKNENKQSYSIAGFWRRLFAFLIDLAILGIPAEILGWVFLATLNKMGSFSQLFGFIFVLPYFGIMNSEKANGQTIGKRALNIAVCHVDGKCVTLKQSFLRTFFLFGFMFFAGMAALFADTSYLGAGLSALGSGFLVGIILMYIINKETRQSFHDLIFNTIVIDLKNRTKNGGIHIKKVSWIISLVFTVLAIAGQAVNSYIALAKPVESNLANIYSLVAKDENLSNIRLTTRTYQIISSSGKTNSTILMVQAHSRQKLTNELIDTTGSRIANILLEDYPQINQYDSINITLTNSFNLGFVSYTSNMSKHYPINSDQ